MQLPKIRVAELVTILESIPLSELSNTKEVRIINELSKTLSNAVADTLTELEVIQKDHNEIVAGYQKTYNEAIASVSEEEERKRILSELNQKMVTEITEKISPRNEELEGKSQDVVTIELDGEKQTKLKEVFEKYGLKKYLKHEVYLQVADALGV